MVMVMKMLREVVLRRGGMTGDSKWKLLMPIFANSIIHRPAATHTVLYTITTRLSTVVYDDDNALAGGAGDDDCEEGHGAGDEEEKDDAGDA